MNTIPITIWPGSSYDYEIHCAESTLTDYGAVKKILSELVEMEEYHFITRFQHQF
jgi:hypothetical protein